MNNSCIQNQSQVLDFVDFETAAVVLEAYRKAAHERWERLDWLYADKAYMESRLASSLHRNGKLDDAALRQSHSEIDSMLNDYDDQVLYRHELDVHLKCTAYRFRQAARAERKRRRESSHAT